MLARCPICQRPTDSGEERDFPFCSERCRLIDLGNWSSEKYRIGEPAADESQGHAAKSPSPDETPS